MGKKEFKPKEEEFVEEGNKQGGKGKKRGKPTSFAFNSPEWINLNPALTEDTAKIMFNEAIGLWTDLTADFGDNTKMPGSPRIKVPSLLALYWVPALGKCSDPKDTLNVATDLIYQNVRSKQNGKTDSYEACDLMQTLLALDNVFALQSLIKRAFKMTGNAMWHNKTVPDVFYGAQNLDYEDLKEHLADYIFKFNLLINKLDKVVCPGSFYYFNRHNYLCSNVYKDSENENYFQTYMFVPEGLWMFDDAHAKLELVDILHDPAHVGERIKVSYWLDLMNTMIVEIYQSSSINKQLSDVAYAFGNDLLKFDAYSNDGQFEPTYDPGLQSQIENMRCYNINPFDEDADWNVTQVSVPGYKASIKFTGTAAFANTMSGYMCTIKNLVNYPWENVEPIDIAYSVELMPAVSEIDYDDGLITFDQTGTEVITKMRYFDGWNQTISNRAPFGSFIRVGGEGDLSYDFLVALESFDYHPCIYVWLTDGESVPQFKGAAMDFAKWTTIPNSVLNGLHNVALQSYWNIKENGRSFG